MKQSAVILPIAPPEPFFLHLKFIVEINSKDLKLQEKIDLNMTAPTENFLKSQDKKSQTMKIEKLLYLN